LRTYLLGIGHMALNFLHKHVKLPSPPSAFAA